MDLLTMVLRATPIPTTTSRVVGWLKEDLTSRNYLRRRLKRLIIRVSILLAEILVIPRVDAV
jgi:hypothetical protein